MPDVPGRVGQRLHSAGELVARVARDQIVHAGTGALELAQVSSKPPVFAEISIRTPCTEFCWRASPPVVDSSDAVLAAPDNQ